MAEKITVPVYINPNHSNCWNKHSEDQVKEYLADFKYWAIREVDDITPDEDDFVTLEDVFRLGQNDFQVKDTRSMCVGDIVILNSKIYLCEGRGFSHIGHNN
jgi:hypothetical protein